MVSTAIRLLPELVPYPPRNPGCVCHIAFRLHGNWDACWAKCSSEWGLRNPRVTMATPYCQYTCSCEFLGVGGNGYSCCASVAS